MHWQVVNTGCGDDDFFLLGAAALYGQRKLGRRAATLPSVAANTNDCKEGNYK